MVKTYKEYPGRQNCAYLYVSVCGTPYYVGAGSLGRAQEMDKALEDGYVLDQHDFAFDGRKPYRIIFDTDSRKAAFELEEKLIRQYGRMDLGTGTLYNQTYGPGRLGRTANAAMRAGVAAANRTRVWKPESLEKLRIAKLGTKDSEEVRKKKGAKLLGRRRPPEFGAKISASKKGKPAHNKGAKHTEETKLKMRAFWAERRIKKEQAQ